LSFISVLCVCRLAGDLLIIMAQVIVAVQMVLEEKFVSKHDVHPLKAVGTEGTVLPGPTTGQHTAAIMSAAAASWFHMRSRSAVTMVACVK